MRNSQDFFCADIYIVDGSNFKAAGNSGQIIRITADEPLRKKLLDSGLASGTNVTLLQVKEL